MSDLDEEEYLATRKLNGLDKEESIEEDIKQLQDLIQDRQSFLTGDEEVDEIYLKDIKAINNLINDNTRQKQINEEHQKINAELREKVKELEEENLHWRGQYHLTTRKIDVIPKQNIKDKIKEIKEDKESKYYDSFLEERDIEITVQILQELLQEEDK